VIDSSFDEFVRGHIGALDRYAYALTGERNAADDLIQETLVRLAGAWRRVNHDGNPSGYATTIMFRTYVSWWRAHRRRPTVELTVEPRSDADAYASVDDRLLLRQALRTLPRLQHAVLVATYLRDSSDDEIAELIGRTPSTVRSLRRRGLKALSAALHPDNRPTIRRGDRRRPVVPPASVAGNSAEEVNCGESGIPSS
jgi:RNA polymerase sigma factor (sigma-70 family)